MNKPTKQQIIDLLEAWIKQRPGLDPANYGFPVYGMEAWKEAKRAYTSESRRITAQLHDARELLRAVELSGGLDADTLLNAFRAFSGRLSIKQDGDEWRLEYCTGQYWPTEYRAAACAVLASALWDYHREDYNDSEHPGDEMRKMFKRRFGTGLASRWLD